MLYIDVFRDFCTNGLGGGTRLRYVQMRSRRAGTAHRGRRSAAPARARYRAKTEKFAFGTGDYADDPTSVIDYDSDLDEGDELI